MKAGRRFEIVKVTLASLHRKMTCRCTPSERCKVTVRKVTVPKSEGVAYPDRRTAIEAELARLAPRIPTFEAEAVIDHALLSAGLRSAVPHNAAWLALVAYARHTFTEYDALLDDDYDRDSARHFVLDDLNAILAEWGVRRTVTETCEPGSALD